jgi:hypothetical protein
MLRTSPLVGDYLGGAFFFLVFPIFSFLLFIIFLLFVLPLYFAAALYFPPLRSSFRLVFASPRLSAPASTHVFPFWELLHLAFTRVLRNECTCGLVLLEGASPVVWALPPERNWVGEAFLFIIYFRDEEPDDFARSCEWGYDCGRSSGGCGGVAPCGGLAIARALDFISLRDETGWRGRLCSASEPGCGLASVGGVFWGGCSSVVEVACRSWRLSFFWPEGIHFNAT